MCTTRRGCLLHSKFQVRPVLLAQDALHRAVRCPSVCVVSVWWPDSWLFAMVHVVCGGQGHFEHPDLCLRGTMTSDLGWQVMVLRPCYLDVYQVCLAKVDAGICWAWLRWSV